MIRSMTGFGAVERESRGGVLQIEIRTENHRHFHTHFRTPVEAEHFEPELSRILRDSLRRGHVRYRLDFQPGTEAAKALAVDAERVEAYLDALGEIEKNHILPRLSGGRRLVRRLFRGPDLELLVRLGDVVRATSNDEQEMSADDLFAATREALVKVITEREREGEALRSDLIASLDAVETALAVVSERAPQRLKEERERLVEAIRQLTREVTVDEERIAREIAYLAEKWDINEEIVRLQTHIDEFRSLLDGDGSEPIGKRLGFWVQEMLREVNTIGSKANDSEIARQVVEAKTAIERIREQVENVE